MGELITLANFRDVQIGLSTNNPALNHWTDQRLDQVSTSLLKREPKNLLTKYRALRYGDMPTEGDIDMQEVIHTLAVHRVERERKELLIKVGSRELETRGLSIGVLTLGNLSNARNDLTTVTGEELETLADLLLSTNDREKKFVQGTTDSRRELVALAIARRRAEKEVTALATDIVTKDDIEAFESTFQNNQNPNGRRDNHIQLHINGGEYIDGDGLREPIQNLFPAETTDILDLYDWAGLPIKPLLIPGTGPIDDSKQGLAEFIWQRILYSPLFVDKNGREVYMDEATTGHYVNIVRGFVAEQRPIEASEYTPLIAIPNPLKRITQSVAMSEVDFFRRLAEVSRTVELYYQPGMVWHVVNEAPAFLDSFGIEGDYADKFHEDCRRIVDAVNHAHGRDVIRLSRMDEFLWGDEDRNSLWEEYRNTRGAEIDRVLKDPSLPESEALRKEVNMFTYPMATCLDPFSSPFSEGLSVREIIDVYERLKTETGSQMRGIGMGKTKKDETLSGQQTALLERLRVRGTELAVNYRLTMGARDVLPSFRPIDNTVKYTMVTKPNKPVLYPNSGRGPSFPAHGEPVLTLRGEWSTVMVEPYVTLLSNRKITPNTAVFSRQTGDVLYFKSSTQ